MSRGKKLMLYLLFFIYLSALAALLFRGRVRAFAEAAALWRAGEAAFPIAEAAALTGIALGLLVLTYAVYYIFAEARKYFPLVLRAAMWLLLVAAAATELSMRRLLPLLESGRFELTHAAALRFSIAAPAAATVIVALFMLRGVRRAVRKTTAAVRELAAGGSGAHVNQFSGDELGALALAINSFAKDYSKTTQGARRRDESYMKFIPSRLVQLMGVDSIGEVDKNTALARVMAVLAVRFKLPETARGADAKGLFTQINEVITRCAEFVHKNGGVIYNFYHDGYEAVFSGAASDAVSAAVAIRQDIYAFNKERATSGEPPVALYTAVDMGEVMMGVVGDESRLAPAAVSVCLNSARYLAELAERLEAGVLCTIDVAPEVEAYAQRYIGKYAKTGSKRVYEIFDGDAQETRAAKEKTRVQFAEGIYLLYARDFSGAKRIFMDIVRQSSADGASKFYLFLADRLEKDGGAVGEERLYLTLRSADRAQP
ncbi:MAG: HAMP domain-containing protein [Oscillospiraceae bacterium]|jgi:HAMP domain-containing protein|nr:HAMP domain-containing protein [Oscillospiraceae bacterium]